MMIDISEEGMSTILSKKVLTVKRDEATMLEQSDVSVINVVLEGDEGYQLLLKNVDVLDQKARIKKTEEKWRISVQSFENEYNFYKLKSSDEVGFDEVI